MKKTNFASFCVNGIPEGCKRCIQGKKLVLFVTGKCSTNCSYCPLSELRKNTSSVWANERKCKNIKEIIHEAKESKATGAGITGGDPLLVLQKTLTYAKALKQKFGKKFHIHIYLSTKLLNESKIKSLSKYIDEIRFHPENLTLPEKHKQDIEKISLAEKYFPRKNIGIEIPVFPDKKYETLQFMQSVKQHIGFLNLNELEIGDSNFSFINKKYPLDKSGYTIKNSIKIGKEILEKLRREKIKVHLCTAETKNWHQYKNRLLQHETLPFGKKTSEGTVIYFSIFKNKNPNFNKLISKIKKKEGYYDKIKQRIILSKDAVKKYSTYFKITQTEEFPTYDKIEAESQDIN